VTPAAGPLRILVVDDEPPILRFLRASLESQGYIVSTAADVDLGVPDATSPGSWNARIFCPWGTVENSCPRVSWTQTSEIIYPYSWLTLD
jgi:hypothetical protein